MLRLDWDGALAVSRVIILLSCQVVALLFLTAGSTYCQLARVITVQPGSTEDLYFEVNLSGEVYVKIATKDPAEACAEFWWITWPLGRIESLGRHCGFATFTIPGLSRLAISSKLRVGGTKTLTKVAVSENSAVAYSWNFDF